MTEAKILIADDEHLNLLLYSEMLKAAGYTIINASNGIEAVNHTINEFPDLIILDWNMPQLDGLGALIEIKKNPDFVDIPVVMITGIMTSPENLRIALESGANDFLRKPFDKIELLARVRSMLFISQSKRELQAKYILIEKNNRFIKELIESIPHPMVYYDLHGAITGYNEKFKQTFTNGESILNGSNVYEYFYNPYQTVHIRQDKELIKTKHVINYESSGGITDRDFIFSKTLYSSIAGLPEGILCIMTDVTELKQAHQEIMETKKRELASSALRLIQMSEMNNKLISELNELNKFTNRKGSDLIREIISNFNIHSNETIWNEFEVRFENVYESFFNTLNQQFPELTPSERKLCSFLRLNLTSKDIAAITFQNPQSIDMARYRLRKKLNLGKDENLVDFLLRIN